MSSLRLIPVALSCLMFNYDTMMIQYNNIKARHIMSGIYLSIYQAGGLLLINWPFETQRTYQNPPVRQKQNNLSICLHASELSLVSLV